MFLEVSAHHPERGDTRVSSLRGSPRGRGGAHCGVLPCLDRVTSGPHCSAAHPRLALVSAMARSTWHVVSSFYGVIMKRKEDAGREHERMTGCLRRRRLGRLGAGDDLRTPVGPGWSKRAIKLSTLY